MFKSKKQHEPGTSNRPVEREDRKPGKTATNNIMLLQNAYENKKRLITSGMVHSYRRALIVWCPFEQFTPDFVVSVMGKYERNVDIRNRWIQPHSKSSENIWGGAVAVFDYDDTAELAAKDLRMISRSIKVIPFPDFLDFLIDADIRHPMCDKENARVLIKGKESFLKKHNCEVQLILHGLGTVEYCKFHNGVTQYGVICEVEYTYASQAFALRTIMNGMFFKSTGTVSVEVVEREKERLMMKTIKRHVMEFVNKF